MAAFNTGFPASPPGFAPNLQRLPDNRQEWLLYFPTQFDKEGAWIAKFGYNWDQRFPYPITTPQMAQQVFVYLLNDKNMGFRAKARRAYLAAEKGGRCEMARLKQLRPELRDFEELPDCEEQVRDYRFLRMWEFNHVIDRFVAPYLLNADGSVRRKQFVISGTDCARRSWANVREHAMEDTVLLCRECHQQITRFDKEVYIEAQRQLYGQPYA